MDLERQLIKVLQSWQKIFWTFKVRHYIHVLLFKIHTLQLKYSILAKSSMLSTRRVPASTKKRCPLMDLMLGACVQLGW